MTIPNTCTDCGRQIWPTDRTAKASDCLARENSRGRAECYQIALHRERATIARMRPVVEAASRCFTADDPAACIAAYRSLKAALESNSFVPKPSPVEVAELIEAASR